MILQKDIFTLEMSFSIVDFLSHIMFFIDKYIIFLLY